MLWAAGRCEKVLPNFLCNFGIGIQRLIGFSVVRLCLNDRERYSGCDLHCEYERNSRQLIA